MEKNKFLKLYEVLLERVKNEGKKSPDWFLGFVEGFGNQKLTGYQIGALYHLMVLQGPADTVLVENENEFVPGDSKVSIPGIT